MKPVPGTAARRAAHAILLLATFLSIGAIAASAQAAPAPTLEILGTSSVGENISRQWVVVLRNLPLASSDSAYAPPQAGTFLDYEPTVEYRWGFGDGTGVVSTGERVSASHTYADDGSFVLTVEAWAEGRRVARGEKSVEVRNRSPVDVLIAAVEIDPSRSLYELSATAVDAADDVLTYSWNFGDGSSAEGPRVEHAFPIAGTYPVTLTVTDDDGGSAEKTLQLVVIGAGTVEESSVDPLTRDATATEVRTSFEAAVRGSLNADVRGRILPVAGIHLAPVEGGRRCRFMFTVADPSQLAMIIMILDLASLPEEGARYRVPFQGSVNFYPDRARYARSARVAGQAIEGAAILDRIVPDDPGHVPSSSDDAEVIAATSPLGIADHVGFLPASGTVELTFVPRDRAVGTFDLQLTNPNRNREEYPEIAMKGSFALDLVAASREGLMLYAKCGEGELELETLIPADGTLHADASRLGATFSHDVDPATLNAETVQLTYPAAGDPSATVVVQSRILRRPRAVILQPEKPLFPGVRYTARVKTGPQGVRGKNGVALEDDDGSGWKNWSFTTRLDLEPGAGNLACHVFQTVRDAPLIAGKPAVARIYADWRPHPEVHESAQVEEFTARVFLESGADGIASEVYRFVRPDRWKSRGIDTAEAGHTANLYWTPDKSSPSFLRVALEVESAPGRVHEKRYFTRCATPLWPHQPVLRVDFYMLQANAWKDAGAFDAARARVQRIIGAAQILMQQLFPFQKVETRFLGPLSRKGDACDVLCARNLLAHREGTSDADVLFAFMPTEEGEEPGGGAFQRLNDAAEPQGLVTFAIDDETAHDVRFVFGVAHEVGHTLWLEHMPTVTEESRERLLAMRGELEEVGGEPRHLYPGIEGFRIVPGGGDGWNKSSSEGNGEGSWIVPLMYPGSMPYREAFIMRHQYLRIQAFLESGNGNPQSGKPPRP